MGDPWFLFYAGRDWLHWDGWRVDAALLPARSLMDRPNDEGRVVLAALSISLRLVWSRELAVDGKRPRPRVILDLWSDADEISTRLASNAGAM